MLIAQRTSDIMRRYRKVNSAVKFTHVKVIYF